MKNYSIDDSDLHYISDEVFEKIKQYIITSDDLYIVIVGSTIGKVGIVPPKFNNMNLTENAARLTPIGICKEYILAAISSDMMQIQFIDKTKQVGQPKLALERIKTSLFPLPPLAEQQRIAAKVDELMALCIELEVAETELDTLEAHFIEYLPKSILQTAVQGKLVPQNKDDEPASELLKRIQAEKAKLIKEGKLKKEKPLPPITEDEIPYDLPEGWVWCMLGDLVQLISGRDLEPSAYNDQHKGIPYITGASAIINREIGVVRWTECPVVISTFGDILLSCKGTVGKIIHNTIGDCHIARQIMAIRTLIPEVDSHYLALALETFVTQLATQAKSMIPGISREDVLYLVYPLPPFVEQKRIVAKVDELMALYDELKHVGEQTIDHGIVIPFPGEEETKVEPLLMAAQGKVTEKPSQKHAAALDVLLGMMDDE